MQRDEQLKKITKEPLDVLVIGGGINGAVSFAALAGQGLKVGLDLLGVNAPNKM